MYDLLYSSIPQWGETIVIPMLQVRKPRLRQWITQHGTAKKSQSEDSNPQIAKPTKTAWSFIFILPFFHRNRPQLLARYTVAWRKDCFPSCLATRWGHGTDFCSVKYKQQCVQLLEGSLHRGRGVLFFTFLCLLSCSRMCWLHLHDSSWSMTRITP